MEMSDGKYCLGANNWDYKAYLGASVKSLYITWTKDYDLGIPIIDEQHRGVVTAINSLFYYMQYERGMEALNPTLRILDEYRLLHFETEEEIMKQYNYSDFDTHVILHRQFDKNMDYVMRESMALSDPQAVLSFLKKWWLSHINNEDRKYSTYIVSKS